MGTDQDHVVQFYDDGFGLITEVGRAMSIALDQGHAVVCIASDGHRRLLELHLALRGIDVATARAAHQITFLHAPEALAKITRHGMPDVARFAEVVGAVIDHAASDFPRVWVFGELVALMCANGNHSGAIELEKLWASFIASRPIFLHCAYPTRVFLSEQDRAAFVQVCDDHCRVLHSDSSLALVGRDRCEGAFGSV